MAEVRVVVLDASIIAALNTPGRPVSNWRDDVAGDIADYAGAISPVNDPLNAVHRGGIVGTYRASWDWERGTSGNQHLVRAVILNRSDHAQAVEYGNPGSSEFQAFSWTAWGGTIKWVGANTKRNWAKAHAYGRARGLGALEHGGRSQGGYPGRHILATATAAVLGVSGALA